MIGSAVVEANSVVLSEEIVMNVEIAMSVLIDMDVMIKAAIIAIVMRRINTEETETTVRIRTSHASIGTISAKEEIISEVTRPIEGITIEIATATVIQTEEKIATIVEEMTTVIIAMNVLISVIALTQLNAIRK